MCILCQRRVPIAVLIWNTAGSGLICNAEVFLKCKFNDRTGFAISLMLCSGGVGDLRAYSKIKHNMPDFMKLSVFFYLYSEMCKKCEIACLLLPKKRAPVAECNTCNTLATPLM